MGFNQNNLNTSSFGGPQGGMTGLGTGFSQNTMGTSQQRGLGGLFSNAAVTNQGQGGLGGGFPVNTMGTNQEPKGLGGLFSNSPRTNQGQGGLGGGFSQNTMGTNQGGLGGGFSQNTMGTNQGGLGGFPSNTMGTNQGGLGGFPSNTMGTNQGQKGLGGLFPNPAGTNQATGGLGGGFPQNTMGTNQAQGGFGGGFPMSSNLGLNQAQGGFGAGGLSQNTNMGLNQSLSGFGNTTLSQGGLGGFGQGSSYTNKLGLNQSLGVLGGQSSSFPGGNMSGTCLQNNFSGVGGGPLNQAQGISAVKPAQPLAEKIDKTVLQLLKPIEEYDKHEICMKEAEDSVQCLSFVDYCKKMNELEKNWSPVTSTVDRLAQEIRYFINELSDLESRMRQLQYNLSPDCKEERGRLVERLFIGRVGDLGMKMSHLKSRILKMASESDLFYRMGLSSPKSSSRYYGHLADLTGTSIGNWESRINELSTVVTQLEASVKGMSTCLYSSPLPSL